MEKKRFPLRAGPDVPMTLNQNFMPLFGVFILQLKDKSVFPFCHLNNLSSDGPKQIAL